MVLSREEIGGLLAAAEGKWRLLFSVAVFTGLRLSELLGLRWVDLDLDTGVVRVRAQLTRSRRDEDGVRTGPELVEPKTRAAIREVVLMPTLGKALREARLAAPPALSGDDAFVFCSAAGRPLDQANVRRALRSALDAAGIGRRVTMHELRHAFASALIASGRDVVFVSRQLGHASPAITLAVYAHLFDSVRHADETREHLEAEFGRLVVRPM